MYKKELEASWEWPTQWIDDFILHYTFSLLIFVIYMFLQYFCPHSSQWIWIRKKIHKNIIELRSFVLSIFNESCDITTNSKSKVVMMAFFVLSCPVKLTTISLQESDSPECITHEIKSEIFCWNPPQWKWRRLKTERKEANQFPTTQLQCGNWIQHTASRKINLQNI